MLKAANLTIHKVENISYLTHEVTEELSLLQKEVEPDGIRRTIKVHQRFLQQLHIVHRLYWKPLFSAGLLLLLNTVRSRGSTRRATCRGLPAILFHHCRWLWAA